MKPVQLVQVLYLALFGLTACGRQPIVHTQNGDVRGVAEGEVESFKGLPFAAPPVVKLRWMPPQEPDNWPGIRDASDFSSECPQQDELRQNAFIGNEDCLYLNVFKPAGAKGLPVMVFIHGGSNVRESASQILNGVHVYDGSRLAQNENVIVVTLNYRLGTLGFMAHPKLTEASGYKGSGNYAYMDQIQALKWVQRNIAAFGGNPGNVTLFGHSAGAKSVWVQLTSPLSEGLFHRAIVHSGVKEDANILAIGHIVGTEISEKLECSSATDELACMRGKPAKDVVEAMPLVRGIGLFGAVIDHKVLMDSPIKIMQRGDHHHMPVLEGNVKDEMAALGLAVSKDIQSEEDYMQAVESEFDDANPDMFHHYPAGEYPSPAQAYNAILADRYYLCSSRRVLRALSAKQKEFVGRFFYTHVFTGGPLAAFGGAHGFELPFVFDTLSAAAFSPTPAERALVKTFQDTWAGFARTGEAPPSWKRYDAQKDNYIIMDTTTSESSHLHAKECDFWDHDGGD